MISRSPREFMQRRGITRDGLQPKLRMETHDLLINRLPHVPTFSELYKAEGEGGDGITFPPDRHSTHPWPGDVS